MMSPAIENAVDDAAALAGELARYRVIDSTRLAAALDSFPGGTSQALAEYLVALELLTPYQAARALEGVCRCLALGPYRLTRVLGLGALGPVYAATDAAGTKSFAVRVFPLRSLWQVRVAKRLIRSLAALPAHPALLTPTDVDSANGFHYLVWPRVEGQSLPDRVHSDGPLSHAEATRIVRQLAEGLAVCHRRGVVHGLLGPQAVHLGADGHARLLELGSAPLLAQNLADAESMIDTLSGAVVASAMLASAAPELLANPTAFSPAADQYGLGIVAHFCLTGLYPYEEEGLVRTLVARQSGAGPIRDLDPRLPAALAHVVDRLLSVNPAARFTSVEEVLEALDGVLAGLGVAASGPPPEAVAEAPAPHASARHRSGSGELDVSQRAGAGSWAGPAGRGNSSRPAERDSTADSIQFDLPEAPAEAEPQVPAAVGGSFFGPSGRLLDFGAPEAPSALHQEDTPPQALAETRTSSPGHDGSDGATPPTALPALEDAMAFVSDRARPEGAKAAEAAEAAPAADPARLLTSLREEALAAVSWGPLPSLPEPVVSPRPRNALPAPTNPVNWTTPMAMPTASDSDLRRPAAGDDPSGAESVLWKSVRRNLLFWQAPADRVQVSLFGPTMLSPGQSAKLEMFLHQPDAAESVRTMVRAFMRDAELLGSGQVTQEVARDSALAVHVALANAGVAQSLAGLVWRGQPHRLSLEVHVPWESPAGLSPGVISVGQDNVRIGRVDVQLCISPRMS